MAGQFLISVKVKDTKFKDFLVSYEGKTYFTTKLITQRYYIDPPDPFPWEDYYCMWMLPVVVTDDIVEIYDRLLLFDEYWCTLDHNNLDLNKILFHVIEMNAYLFDLDSVEGRHELMNSYRKRFWSDTFDSTVTQNRMRDQKPKHDFVRKVGHSLKEYVPVEKIIGSLHPDYSDKSWEHIFYDLKRGHNTLLKCLINKDSEMLYKSAIQSFGSIGYEKYKDRYYVSAGSHRTTAALFMNIDMVGPVPVTYYEQDICYKESYRNLIEYGYDIKLYDSYELSRKGIYGGYEYSWEVFAVQYQGNELFLIGLENIQQYLVCVEEFMAYSKLNVAQKIIFNVRNNFPKYHDSIPLEKVRYIAPMD